MTRVHLVRHADAAPRAKHHAGDADRPLTERGWRQAVAVADALGDAAIHSLTAVISSPAVRCVSTVEPTARRAGLRVSVDHRLAEGSGSGAVFAMLRDRTAGTVLCSHGDVIGDVVHALIGRGLVPADQAEWAKASTWVLDVDGGTVVAARYEPPAA